MTEPAVVAFFHDHGTDVRDVAIWRLSTFNGERSRIPSRDPFRAEVDFVADGDRLTLTVDESLSVLDAERVE